MKKVFITFLMLLTALAVSIQSTYAYNEIVGPDVIYKEDSKVLTISQIVAMYESVEGSIVVVEDNYTGNGDVPGVYSILLQVDGTSYIKEIEISVRNEIGNVIAVTNTQTDYVIHVNKNITLTSNNIIDVLVNVQYIQVSSTTEITLLTNSYAANSNSPGDYVFEFHLANTAGFEQTYEIGIRVTNTEKLVPDIVIEDENSFPFIWNTIKPYILGFLVIVGLFVFIKYMNRRKRGFR